MNIGDVDGTEEGLSVGIVDGTKEGSILGNEDGTQEGYDVDGNFVGVQVSSDSVGRDVLGCIDGVEELG